MSSRTGRGAFVVVLTLALGVFAVACATAGSATGSRTYVASNCSNAAFKPRQIVLACGDAGLIATKLQWTQWGRKKAHGAGLGKQRVCKPTCVAGKIAKGAMKLVLSRPRYCRQDGKRHFTKVHYKWIPAAPAEGPNRGTTPLPCSLAGN
jgi:hypothetical protein